MSVLDLRGSVLVYIHSLVLARLMIIPLIVSPLLLASIVVVVVVVITGKLCGAGGRRVLQFVGAD